MPARSTAARYAPKWYAAADTSAWCLPAIALYDRSAPERLSFRSARTIWFLFQIIGSTRLLFVLGLLNSFVHELWVRRMGPDAGSRGIIPTPALIDCK